jgi:hypothetical protein
MALPTEEELLKKKPDPTLENDDFAVDIEGDPEIEIEDDTPPADRNRKPLPEDDKAPTDEELEKYSEDVKRRIGKEIHRYHDERRAKEAVTRERDEAVAAAQKLLQEKKALESRYKAGEDAFINQTKAKVTLSMAEAKRAYKSAYELGDAEAMADAQEKIAEAKLEQQRAEEWSRQATQRKADDEARQAEESVVQRNQQSQERASEPDPDAVKWANKNKWFGQDEEMTQFAYGVHAKLVKAGIDPTIDAPEYYQKLDSRMREVFPTFEWEDAPRKQTRTVVAPVTRTSKTATRIKLTQSQVAVAKRMGITPLQYAVELAKLSGEK